MSHAFGGALVSRIVELPNDHSKKISADRYDSCLLHSWCVRADIRAFRRTFESDSHRVFQRLCECQRRAGGQSQISKSNSKDLYRVVRNGCFCWKQMDRITVPTSRNPASYVSAPKPYEHLRDARAARRNRMASSMDGSNRLRSGKLF
jgi:hypothetical protein